MKMGWRMVWVAWGLLVSAFIQAEPVKLATTDLVSTSFPEVQAVVVEAFEQAGHSVELVTLPGERALMMLKSNEVDADVMRLVNYNELVPNAVPVEVPLITLELFAIVHQESAVQRVSELRGTSMSSERGVKVAEVVAQQMNARIQYQNRIEDSVKMVQNGRVDFTVLTRPMLESLKESGYDLRALEEPVLELPYYVWLSEESAHLKPGITAQLQRMSEAGRY